MDRIHRLGQHRPVQAIKLVIEDSIESRIVQVGIRLCPPSSSVDVVAAAGEEVRHGRRYAVHRRFGHGQVDTSRCELL